MYAMWMLSPVKADSCSAAERIPCVVFITMFTW
jgi:hypothetical protein